MAIGYKIPKSHIPSGSSLDGVFSEDYVDIGDICTYRSSSKRASIDYSNLFKKSSSSYSTFKFSCSGSGADTWNIFMENSLFKTSDGVKELMVKGSCPTFKNDPFCKLYSPGKYIISRSNSELKISGNENLTFKKDSFSDNVIPTAFIFFIQGAGGGGAYGSAKSKKTKSGGGETPKPSPTTSYDKKPGGGGGAGGFLAGIIDFKNLPNNSNTITVHIGKGGNGGSINNPDGEDGGSSFLEISNQEASYAGGGDGGKHYRGQGGISAIVNAAISQPSGIDITGYVSGGDGGNLASYGDGCSSHYISCTKLSDVSRDYANYVTKVRNGGSAICNNNGGGGGGASAFHDGGNGGNMSNGKDGYCGSGGGGGGCKTADIGYHGGDGGNGFLWLFY